MKKTFILVVTVLVLLSVNAAAVSAECGITVTNPSNSNGFVLLGHGVDH
ncbi:hypothetical protein [Paenibacillus sp. FSL R7-0273]|nr:hypothetical protein [Paenibacillus sp. FSL R7-0273]